MIIVNTHCNFVYVTHVISYLSCRASFPSPDILFLVIIHLPFPPRYTTPRIEDAYTTLPRCCHCLADINNHSSAIQCRTMPFYKNSRGHEA